VFSNSYLMSINELCRSNERIVQARGLNIRYAVEVRLSWIEGSESAEVRPGVACFDTTGSGVPRSLKVTYINCCIYFGKVVVCYYCRQGRSK
jgi:hypothetical protein